MTPVARSRFARGAIVAATLAAAGTLVVGYGWRYGLAPLPDPVPGCRLEPLPDLRWSEATTNHAWYWFRELHDVLSSDARRLTPARPSAADWGTAPTWALAVENWAQSGRLAAEARQGLEPWLAAHPEVDRCFRSVLASTDSRMPALLETGSLARAFLLSYYPLLLAGGAETDGRCLDGFRALTDAWRFQARLTPAEEFLLLFDERGAEQLNAHIARPWRRLALAGPTLALPEVRQVLEDLAKATNLLCALESSYRYRLALGANAAASQAEPDWPRVRTAFRVAGLRLRQEFGGVVSALLDRLTGGRRPAPLKAEGIRHLARPLRELLVAAQRVVARPEDVQRLREARVSCALAELRGTAPQPLAVWPRRDRWPAWRRVLDRPAVWQSVESLPDPVALRVSRNDWLVLLESCRLTLALRAFRDRLGRWPADWDELVPAILPAVPLDPFSGKPFAYERTADGWVFWAVGPAGLRPTPEEAQYPPQRLFLSREAAQP